jgi:hypothetical protein
MGVPIWTAESEQMLRAMHGQGCSHLEISIALATKLGFKVSRSAVIGKASRLLGNQKKRYVKATPPRAIVDNSEPKSAIAIMPKKRSVERQAQWGGQSLDTKPHELAIAPQRTSTKASNEPQVNVLNRISQKLRQAPSDLTTYDEISDCELPDQLVQLTDLQRGDCHWPYGTPGRKGFGYCGCKVKSGGQYCEKHWLRMISARQPARNISGKPQHPSRTLTDEGRKVNVQY